LQCIISKCWTKSLKTDTCLFCISIWESASGA
jgi:hypothetical protein